MDKAEKPWLSHNNWQGTWRDDWRIQGQEGYLLNKHLQHRRFCRALCVEDFDQCEFCWKVFDEDKNDPQFAYFESDEKVWICEDCFNDFKPFFRWTAEEFAEPGSDQYVKND